MCSTPPSSRSVSASVVPATASRSSVRRVRSLHSARPSGYPNSRKVVMRVACLPLLAALASALAPVSGSLPAQESSPPQYALALRARYLPLESVRDGTLRMPKALERRVSVRRTGVPLQQVLLDIATQASLGLSYGEDLAKSRTMVSL